MSKKPSLEDLTDELNQLPGKRILQELRGLDLSVFTLVNNYNDFKRLIGFLTTDPRANHLLAVRNRDQLDETFMHIARLLHNFVAAVKSLVDHTNTLHKKLNVGPNKLNIEPKPFLEYKARISTEFAQDALSQFVQRLRNYCQHYRLPVVGLKISIVPSASLESKAIHLSKTGLLESSDMWTDLAKQFLSQQPEEIDILRIVTDYCNKVNAFQDWFQQREREIFAEEVAEFMDKQAEKFRLRIELEIDARKDFHGIYPLRKEDVFLYVFSSQDFDVLEKTPPDSFERAEKAISIVESYFPISQELKDKIKALYIGEK